MQDFVKIIKIWQYRQLLYFLTIKEIKVRYKQAFFGIAWAILTPLSQALVFAFIFGILLKTQINNIPYLLLVFSGFTFWNFFALSISSATSALTGNTNLVTKSTFPKEILVLASVFGRLPDLLASLTMLLIMLAFYQINFSMQLLWIIPMFAIEVILALGIGLFFAAANVYFRDITALVPLLLMLWLYLTPVVYSLSLIPKAYQFFISLNPMTGILEGVRGSLFLQKSPDISALILLMCISLTIFIINFILFKKLEKGFADII
ncbi:ABC transporter permease [Candidatus Daviesbacteria bacterium]|nr:ABC transporter permease [Candidatus Daviesbacteria bacterium]